MNAILTVVAVVTLLALVLVVYGQEWAVGLAGLGIVILVGAAALSGRFR